MIAEQMRVKVYRYGLLAPIIAAESVAEQMRAAQRYRNTLVEIERGRRAALRRGEAQDPALAGLRAAEQWLDGQARALSSAIKAARANKRTRSAPAELRAELRRVREQVKRARFAMRLYRALVALPKMQQQRDRINDLAATLRRSARAHCGVYWGTYLLIESADAAARKQPLWAKGQPNDPSFMRWRGQGSVGVQIQKGMDVASLKVDRRLQIAAGRQLRRCSGRGTHKRCGESCQKKPGKGARQARVLRLRIGSDGRDPIWAEWPLRLHRPLPVDACIMGAAVHLRRHGPRQEWSLAITVREPAPACPRGDQIAVAVDVGWRKLDDGMRVAYWRGEDGEHGELALSAYQIAGLHKAEGIAAVRDKAKNLMHARLKAWLKERELPAWLQQATAHIASWKSAGRFAALSLRWADNRFDGDSDGYAALASWRYRDHHLWAYESGQRLGAQRQRRDMYRCFAVKLARRYGVVVIEQFDKRRMNRLPLAEDDANTQDQHLRVQQRIAATSTLCEALANAFRRDAAGIVEANAAYTTRHCHICGSDLSGDPADDITQRCEQGHVWDQDDNACHNLLARYRERCGDGPDPATARADKQPKSESRWQRARRLRAEKDARQAALADAPAEV